jgi:hypothetical protein
MRNLHIICTPSPKMAKYAVKETPIAGGFLGVDAVVDRMRGAFYDSVGWSGVGYVIHDYDEGEIGAALDYMLSAVRVRAANGGDIAVEYPAIGAHVTGDLDEKCRETIDAIVCVAVACGYMVTLHDLVGYGDIAFGSSRYAPRDRYGAYVFEVKRRAAQVREGVDVLLAKYRSGGQVVHRYYDYDYSLDDETVKTTVSVSDAIKSALFSSRCIDKVTHNKDGKVTYMTVGNDYEKFSRNADKACELMLRAGRARHLVVLGDYFKHAKTASDVKSVLRALHTYDLVDLSVVTRLTLLEGRSDYLLRRALILGEENPMSNVAALTDGDDDLRESLLKFLSRLKVASTVSIKDSDAPNGWRYIVASNRVASVHDALCLIGCEGVKVQARALMDAARFVQSGAFTMEETDEGVRQLLAASIAEECQRRGDMRMVNAASRSDRAEERRGVMWCGSVDGPSAMRVESF